MKKILVIDDSALMRKKLRDMLENAGYEVEVARNGQDGLDKIRGYQPDVVTLDINMPVMDGLTCLSHIMTETPLPVIMVSSLTEKGAMVTFEALEMGAVDYVAKPGGTVSLNIDEVESELLRKIKAALRSRYSKARTLGSRIKKQSATASAKPVKTACKPVARKTVTKNTANGQGIVIIGVSTGGPGTLEKILPHIPANFPWPILVAQHMPAKFTEVFAKRLNKLCDISIVELNRAIEMEAGTAYIARGDADVKMVSRKDKVLATSIPPRSEFLWHPSVELMARSVGEFYDPASIVCVQLTGMGNDGAEAMAALHREGARTIAESENSAVVFGMPQVLIELGGADKILDAEDIAPQLIEWVC